MVNQESTELGNYEERKMGMKGPPPKGKGRGYNDQVKGKSKFGFERYLKQTNIPYTFKVFKVEDTESRDKWESGYDWQDRTVWDKIFNDSQKKKWDDMMKIPRT